VTRISDRQRKGAFRRLCMAILAAAPLLACAASASDNGEWIDVPPQSLIVAEDSALDFSALRPRDAAGSHGPLRLREDGTLGFAAASEPERFNCGLLASAEDMQPVFPDHAEADALADQLARHGYTLARLHAVDQRLTRSAPAGELLDREQLDRFHYLLAALKKRGIYWFPDILTHGDRELAKADYATPTSPDDLRVRVNFDPAARARWLAFVDAAFASRNPYTGMSTLADPALAMVVGANENGIPFSQKPGRPYPTGLADRFDAWMHAEYPEARARIAALPDASPEEREGGKIAPPADWTPSGARMPLFMRFISDLELDTNAWMTARLRERGFVGPVLGNHEWYPQMTSRTRSRLPVVDVHAYVGEVTSFAKGSRFLLPSTTSNQGLGAWMLNASARWLGKPFVMSEYASAYPNPYRYESGLFVPALAAFQGYTAICRMAFLPVDKAMPAPGDGRPALRGYTVGIDPTERAAETLSALLFFRGDVRPATSTIAVAMDETDMGRPGSVMLPMEARRGVLLAGFGLFDPAKAGALPARTRVVASSPVPLGIGEKVMSRVTEFVTGSGAARLDQLVAEMRAAGELPASNRTDPANGIFESQTGELLLDQRRSRVSVTTARTEAVATNDADGPVVLGSLTLSSVDGGALVAASSLDDRPLSQSRRILLILAGDSRNSGMNLGGSGIDRTLVDWGRTPIRIRRVRADLSLHSRLAKAARLTVLALNGTRLVTSAVPSAGGRVRLRLDTAAVPKAPTTFFLLELD
jgi:hypothetical protein